MTDPTPTTERSCCDDMKPHYHGTRFVPMRADPTPTTEAGREPLDADRLRLAMDYIHVVGLHALAGPMSSQEMAEAIVAADIARARKAFLERLTETER